MVPLESVATEHQVEELGVVEAIMEEQVKLLFFFLLIVFTLLSPAPA